MVTRPRPRSFTPRPVCDATDAVASSLEVRDERRGTGGPGTRARWQRTASGSEDRRQVGLRAVASGCLRRGSSRDETGRTPAPKMPRGSTAAWNSQIAELRKAMRNVSIWSTEVSELQSHLDLDPRSRFTAQPCIGGILRAPRKGTRDRRPETRGMPWHETAR